MKMIDERTIQRFIELLQQRNIECHAMSIYQNGSIVLQKAWHPFEIDELHPLFSVTKSFTSMAIGFLEEEGKVCVNDTWISYFPEYQEIVADQKFLKVTLHHLLTMSLGQDTEVEITKGDDWIKIVLGKELIHEPGSVYLYNSYCSHLLSALVSKVTGISMKDYLHTRLFEPLGITNYQWEEDLYGRTLGGYGLHLNIKDLTKFGVCCLHRGVYQNKQVLPERWIDKATIYQMETAPGYSRERSENRQGYGYQFWMCTRGAYRCSGLHGQLCFIQPENDLVIAMQSATTGSQPILECLFEAIDDMEESSPVAFSISLCKGEAHSEVLKPWLNQTLPANDNYFGIQSIFIQEEKSNQLIFEIMKDSQTYRIKAGYQQWLKQKDEFLYFNPFMTQIGIKKIYSEQSNAAFANYAWKTKTTLQVDIREWDRACATSFIFEFDQNHLVLRYSVKALYTMITDTKCVFSHKI